MPRIVLENLGKTYPGGHTALRNLNLDVPAGEWLGVVGPSGSGKTTLLRILAGLEDATRGAIRFDGRDVAALPPWRRGVAMVFQRPALMPYRSVRDLLTEILAESGFAAADRENRWKDVVDLLELGSLLDRRARSLSGGESQRVSLARAVLRAAPILLLDEPLGHLDAPLRRKILVDLPLLRPLLPTTILYVTHDPWEARHVGDRIAVVRAGGCEQVAAPEDLRFRPHSRFVAELFFNPDDPLNILPIRLVAGREGKMSARLDEGFLDLSAACPNLIDRDLDLVVPASATLVAAEESADAPGIVLAAAPLGSVPGVLCKIGAFRLLAAWGRVTTPVPGSRVRIEVQVPSCRFFRRTDGLAVIPDCA